jgi:hypothetical protein
MRSAPATAWSLWVSSDLLLGYAWHGMAGGVHPGQSPSPVHSAAGSAIVGRMLAALSADRNILHSTLACRMLDQRARALSACVHVGADWACSSLLLCPTLSSHACCLQTSLLPGAMAASALTQSCARSRWTLTCRSKSSLSRSVMADALLCWLTEFTTPLLLQSHMVQASAR